MKDTICVAVGLVGGFFVKVRIVYRVRINRELDVILII